MERIIEDGLGDLKSRIEEIVERFKEEGLTPQSLSMFEHQLQDALGEMGGRVEKAVLEAADMEDRWIDEGPMRHYWKYKGPQEYQGLFGKIEVVRSVYQANGHRTICPLEMNAGILHHHLTPAAAEFVAYSMAHMVPGELAEFCRRWQYLTPSETVIKQVAAEVGKISEVLSEGYEEKARQGEPALEGASLVTFSRDGTCVNVRDEGWRQAQVGAISFYGAKKRTRDGKDKRPRLRTTYLSQMPEEKTPTFDAKFEREVAHALENASARALFACIADGARSIWKYFENHPVLKDAVHINDFWHVAERLSTVSDVLFGKGTEKAKSWFKKYRKILKAEDDGAMQMIRSIRYYRKCLRIRSAQRLQVIKAALRYFTRNRERMHYAEYRRRGLPIGSGVVEAGCKTVVGHRLKRAGMRWSIEGGQSILNLRTAVLSRRWDSFWQCHQNTLVPLLRLRAA